MVGNGKERNKHEATNPWHHLRSYALPSMPYLTKNWYDVSWVGVAYKLV